MFFCLQTSCTSQQPPKQPRCIDDDRALGTLECWMLSVTLAFHFFPVSEPSQPSPRRAVRVQSAPGGENQAGQARPEPSTRYRRYQRRPNPAKLEPPPPANLPPIDPQQQVRHRGSALDRSSQPLCPSANWHIYNVPPPCSSRPRRMPCSPRLVRIEQVWAFAHACP